MKIKAGDLVRVLKGQGSGPYCIEGHIYEVDHIEYHAGGSNDSYLYFKGSQHYNSGWNQSRVELVNKEIKLQDLIAVANEGRLALEKLFAEAPERLEIESKDGQDSYGRTGWQPLKSIKNLHYRLKVKPKMESWKTTNGWSVSEGNGVIVIGCKSFDIADLKQALKAIIDDNVGRYALPSGSEFHASFRGIKHDGHILSWADATKLLNALEKM